MAGTKAPLPVLRPQATTMLSRVAHSLYWMSRYIERAENTARLLEVNLQFLLDFQNVAEAKLNQHWESLVLSTGDEELFEKLYDTADSQTVTEFLAFDLRNPSSIMACVNAARENARMIRDQISVEMWEAINELHLFLKSRSTAAVWADGPNEFFGHIKRASHLFQGLTASTYSRSEGWEFIEFGKFLERADKTTRILDVKYHILLPSATDVGGAVDTAQWQAVLRSASALEAYRRYYVREILAWKAAEFLIFSDTFPRSLHFCVAQVDDYLRRILGETGARPRTDSPAPRAACSLICNRSRSPTCSIKACTNSSWRPRPPSRPSGPKSSTPRCSIPPNPRSRISSNNSNNPERCVSFALACRAKARCKRVRVHASSRPPSHHFHLRRQGKGQLQRSAAAPGR